MTTAEQLLKMSQNKQKQKATFWLKNIRRKHGVEHYKKLCAEIKLLRESENVRT